jgi:hypothetical protein
MHKKISMTIVLFLSFSISISADGSDNLDALLFDAVLSVYRGGNREDKIKNIENLLKSGANPNSLHGNHGYYINLPSTSASGLIVYGEASPLMVANSIDVVALLLSYGADINFQDNHGLTALMIYTYFFTMGESQYENIFLLLIEKGADINRRDNLGRTALYYAFDMAKPTIIRTLLQNGANVNNEDNNQFTPLQVISYINPGSLAAEIGLNPRDLEIIRILEEAGAVKVFNDYEVVRMWGSHGYFWHYPLEVGASDR